MPCMPEKQTNVPRRLAAAVPYRLSTPCPPSTMWEFMSNSKCNCQPAYQIIWRPQKEITSWQRQEEKAARWETLEARRFAAAAPSCINSDESLQQQQRQQHLHSTCNTNISSSSSTMKTFPSFAMPRNAAAPLIINLVGNAKQNFEMHNSK